MEGKFVSYLRVSTDRQGRSGLGLDAQREAVAAYLNGGSWELLAEFVEVESGKRDDRPKLAEALDRCRLTGATLVIAKLDRLSRDAHFLLGLQKAGVRFVAADMPDANELTVGLLAVVAQHERRIISERTKAALQAAKTRGRKLGSPRGADHLRGKGYGQLGAVANRDRARSFAASLRPVVEEIRAEGATGVRAITAELNRRNILSPRGQRWHPAGVARLLDRFDATKAET